MCMHTRLHVNTHRDTNSKCGIEGTSIMNERLRGMRSIKRIRDIREKMSKNGHGVSVVVADGEKRDEKSVSK